MSDFDAEAERKRLREKYESEAEDRKRTQQMSELLLKGATMTNAHCGECGSPIFRYEDEEFCPNCQRTADEADGETQAAGDGTSTGETASTDASANTDASAGTTGTVPDANGVAPADATAASRAETDAAPAGGGDDATRREAADPVGRHAGETPDAGGEAATPGRQTAAEALYAAVTRHARLAADADDPRRAREHLSAAREAAAAVDELDAA